MAKKDLKYFMRSNETEIVSIPGPESFKDENGEIINLEIKILTQLEIQKIYNNYQKRGFATDKKGNPLISGGEVVWKTERDSLRSARHIIVEALQYPNLKDKELMDYYKCNDITEMPLLVFSRADEFQYVSRMVMSALGLGNYRISDNEILEEAKN